MDAADQPITAVQNGDPDFIHHPPPKEINGVISEEDREITVEELVEEIESFVEEETKVDTEGADDRHECVSEVIVESLDVPLVAPADQEYSAVASSDGGTEVVVAAVREEEEKEEEKEVEAAALVVIEQLEEVKSTEAELPVSLDRAVGECQFENVESEKVESVQYSGGPESAGENQPNEVITTNQFVHHSSWKDCCGLFDVLRRRSNQ